MEKYGFAAEQLWAEPYRAWTAAFLHLTPTHAVLNAAVWLMFCLFAKRAGVFSGVVAVLMIAWPASNALMVLLPDHQTMRVVGLSGVLYAFWAALSVVGLSQARLRALSLASLAVLSLGSIRLLPVRFGAFRLCKLCM
jgi:membrane associated rhomboid family serine protease